MIGRGGYRIPREEAWDAVAGLTLGQDLSERLQQLAEAAPVLAGQVAPGLRPHRPAAVTPDQLADRDDLALRVEPRRRGAPARADQSE